MTLLRKGHKNRSETIRSRDRVVIVFNAISLQLKIEEYSSPLRSMLLMFLSLREKAIFPFHIACILIERIALYQPKAVAPCQPVLKFREITRRLAREKELSFIKEMSLRATCTTRIVGKQLERINGLISALC